MPACLPESDWKCHKFTFSNKLWPQRASFVCWSAMGKKLAIPVNSRNRHSSCSWWRDNNDRYLGNRSVGESFWECPGSRAALSEWNMIRGSHPSRWVLHRSTYREERNNRELAIFLSTWPDNFFWDREHRCKNCSEGTTPLAIQVQAFDSRPSRLSPLRQPHTRESTIRNWETSLRIPKRFILGISASPSPTRDLTTSCRNVQEKFELFKWDASSAE